MIEALVFFFPFGLMLLLLLAMSRSGATNRDELLGMFEFREPDADAQPSAHGHAQDERADDA